MHLAQLPPHASEMTTCVDWNSMDRQSAKSKTPVSPWPSPSHAGFSRGLADLEAEGQGHSEKPSSSLARLLQSHTACSSCHQAGVTLLGLSSLQGSQAASSGHAQRCPFYSSEHQPILTLTTCAERVWRASGPDVPAGEGAVNAS